MAPITPPPFTLRGLNPDQVLVLINGKRQHQSSLLNTNGTIGRGSSGVDINTIALQSIERIEVLRDGAATQYGLDAIAGIINIILKGFGQHNDLITTWGKTSRGDGITRQLELFVIRPLTADGFVNLTAELRDRGRTNRAGADTSDGNRINTHFGDADTQDGLFVLNAEMPSGDTAWYVQGTLDRRQSSAGAFFRPGGDERNITLIYPDGFLPLIEPKINDMSFTTGVKGVQDTGIRWDLSYTRGGNQYHFYVNHSLNRSLGDANPRSFDSGQTRYTQQIINLDLNQKLSPHNLAGGLEYSQEDYRISRGDEASFVLGPYSEWYPGAQGFGGFMPDNEVSATRHSLAAYFDVKYTQRDWITVGGAVRAEQYNDFGSTLNGKLALRLQPTRQLLLRTSASSGFRAPSLTQSHFTSTAMVRNSEEILQYGIFGVDHPVAKALGATNLKPEKSKNQKIKKSKNLTLEAVFEPRSKLSLSADFFVTDIDDRIMQTGYISGANLASLSPQAVEILSANHVDGAVYSTNAVSTRTQGFDLRLDLKHELNNGNKLKVAGAYHRSSTNITRVNAAPSVLGVSMTDLILDTNTRVTMERGQPQDSVTLWTKLETTNFDVVLNLQRFGSFSSTNGTNRVDFAPKWTLDAELAYRLKKMSP